MKCAVVNCNKSNEGKSSNYNFFRFPRDSATQKKWISFCGRKNFNPKTSFVCMDHFKVEDFENNLQYEMGFAERRFIKKGSIPSIKVSHSQNDKLYEQRARRIERRENKKIVESLLKNHSFSLPTSQNHILQSFEYIDIANNNDTTMETCVKIENHHEQMQCAEIPSSDAIDFYNLNQKVETLEKEILVLKKEKINNDAELKLVKEKLKKMEQIHKYEMEQMKKCLAKTKFELSCVEEKLQVIYLESTLKRES